MDLVNRGELMSELAGPQEVPVTCSRGQADPVAVRQSEAAQCQLSACVSVSLCGGGRCFS